MTRCRFDCLLKSDHSDFSDCKCERMRIIFKFQFRCGGEFEAFGFFEIQSYLYLKHGRIAQETGPIARRR